MKTIQKLTLGLLSVVAASSLSAAALELDTAAGNAEMAGVITGAAKKLGANVLALSADNSSTLTALEISAGSVSVANNNNLMGPITFTGGDLSTGSAVSAIPAIVMTNDATITNAHALTIGDVSGAAALGLAGTYAVTMTGSALLADCHTIASLTAVDAQLNTGTQLPGTASFSGDLAINTGYAGAGTEAVTLGSAGQIHANINVANGCWASLSAPRIVFASGVVFSQDVTAN